MNVSKLVDEDEPLFVSLIDDLFPGLKVKAFVSEASKLLQNAIKQVCEEKFLSNYATWNLKIIQVKKKYIYLDKLIVYGLIVNKYY